MSFSNFWHLYPRKEKKADALKAWGQVVTMFNVQAVLEAVAQQAAHNFNGRDIGLIPLPATWLRGERWLDPIYDYKRTDVVPAISRPALSPEIINVMQDEIDYLKAGGSLEELHRRTRGMTF